MTKKAESRLQLNIRRELKRRFGGWWVKIHGSLFQVGYPDILGCVDGLFFALEVKTDKGKLSELQIYNLQQISKFRGCAATVRSAKEAVEVVSGHLENFRRVPKRRRPTSPISKNSGNILPPGTGEDAHDFGTYVSDD